MSTSILYHAFGLKGVGHKATHFVADRIIFSAKMSDQWVRPNTEKLLYQIMNMSINPDDQSVEIEFANTPIPFITIQTTAGE